MRIVHVRIDHKLLLEMLTQDWQTPPLVTCIVGLPKGARILRSFTDDVQGWAILVVEHESFDEVTEGALPALFTPVHQIETCGCDCTVQAA